MLVGHAHAPVRAFEELPACPSIAIAQGPMASPGTPSPHASESVGPGERTAGPTHSPDGLPRDDPSLEEMLPAEFEGSPLFRGSHRGTNMADDSLFDTRLVKRFDKESDDFSEAFGVAGTYEEAWAIRLRGVTGNALLRAW